MDNFKDHPIVAVLLLLVFGTGAAMSCPLQDFGKKNSTFVRDHIPPTRNTSFEWGSEFRPHDTGFRAWDYVKNLHQDPVAFFWPKTGLLIPFNDPLLTGDSACGYRYDNSYTIDRDAPIIASRDGIKHAEAFVPEKSVPAPGKSRTTGAELERDDMQSGVAISRFAKLIFNYAASDKDLTIEVDSGPGNTAMAFRPEAVGISQADFLNELRSKKVEYKGFVPLRQLATSDQLGSMDLSMDQLYILMTPGREYTLEFRGFTLQPSGLTALLLFSPTGALIAATRIDTNLLDK